MRAATRGGRPGLALRLPAMRCVAQRPEPRRARSSGRLGAAVAIAAGLALLGGTARALNTPDEDDQQELQSEETLPSYEGTQLIDDHDPEQAAHPLHIVAYGLHPVGVALDWILVRPAVWVVRHEPFRTIFGYQD